MTKMKYELFFFFLFCTHYTNKSLRAHTSAIVTLLMFTS